MGFNWKLTAFYFALIVLAGFTYRLMGLPTAQMRVMDVITVLGLLGVLLLVSPVARHNIRQALKRDGHQWAGDGPECAICHKGRL